MMDYRFAFTIDGFDQWGQEHRLTTHPHEITRESGMVMAVKDLVNFAAKLLHCKPDHLAAKRIMLKSAWRGKERIPTKDLLNAMLKAGFAGKGREEERITTTPKKPYHFNKRRH